MSATASGVRATWASNSATRVAAESPTGEVSAASTANSVSFQRRSTSSRSAVSSSSMSPTAAVGAAATPCSTRRKRAAKASA
ncbi:Uncharacterised protein [Mycobacteroides abscessus subsp. abscessus]|nr:Uncharacterised protein [Mycobacteroides abscessus subsp. abscessus]